MLSKKTSTIILVALASLVTNAQTTVNPVNTIYSTQLTTNSTPERMVFKPGSNVTSSAFLASLNNNTKSFSNVAPTSTKIILQGSETDELNFKHSFYIQTLNNVEIENAVVRLHEKGGYLTSVGITTKDVNGVNATPTLTVDQAIVAAKGFSGASKFFENDKWFISETPKLIICSDGGNMVLTYKVDLIKSEPYGREYIYINAHNGSFVKRINRIHNCGSATVPTLYNGNQSINFNVYNYLNNNQVVVTTDNHLLDDCRTATCGASPNGQILTCKAALFYKPNDPQLYIGPFPVTNPISNNWPSTSNITEYSAHFAMAKTYDYYKCTHNRLSYDNKNTQVVGITNADYYLGDVDNAAWSGSQMLFGNGGGAYAKSPLVSVDITGHEFTHAVTDSRAKLDYLSESGALNEAWSDIFGADIEFFVKGASANYNLGEDVWRSGYMRSMSNPKSRNQPNTYQGTYWASTDNISVDYGGVHTNSGVANYWFYLLSEGGTGTNDNGNVYNVTGITRAKAIKIAYRALNIYFIESTNFAQARELTIQAARDLYGNCSAEALQTANAWYAVGVGGNVLAESFTAGPATICAGSHVSYNAIYSTDLSADLILPVGYQSGYFSNGGPDHQTGDIVMNTGGFFKLTLTDTYGCSNSKSIPVTVNPLPTIGTITGNATMCTGTANQLACIPSGGTWGTSNPNLATVSTTGLVSATIQAVDKPVISYTLKSAFGCYSRATKTIQVYASPTVGAISGNSTVCIGVPTTLTCTPTGGTWSSSNSSVASISNAGVVTGLLSNSTNPTIRYAVTNGTCSSTSTPKTIQVLSAATDGNSFTTPIVISNNITCGFTYSNSNNTSNCFSNKYGQTSADVIYKFTITAPRKLKISTCGSGFDTWLNVLDVNKNLLTSNDDNGALCTGSSASLNYNFASAGTYYIVVEGYGAANGAYTLNVTLDPASNCSATRVGEVELETEELLVFPNPAQSQIQVNKPGTKAIMSSLGVELLRTENDVVDISGLPSGVYIIKLINNDKIESKSFVKK